MPRKGCEAAPAILVGAQILGLLSSPFAAQGRSYTDRVDGIDMGMGELCGSWRQPAMRPGDACLELRPKTGRGNGLAPR